MPERPNILLITSDQQRWDTLGRVNPLIKTPNLDRLADDGTLFERAYTCNPVCTPARVSILTGHYPSRHGCYTIGTSLPEGYPTIPEELSRQGYFTGILGKAHFQACALGDFGPNDGFESEPRIHDHAFFDAWGGPYYGFEHARLCIGHSTERKACGMHYGAWLRAKGVKLEDYFGKTPYHGFGAWDLPEEFHNSTWVADMTIDAIGRARAAGKPFFLWSSFQDPHNPCYVPEPWAGMYDPSALPDYHHTEGEFAGKPGFYDAKYRTGDFGIDFGKNSWHCVARLDNIPGAEDHRRHLAMYYGMVSLMDRHIGRILDALRASGAYENTLIVFTSDHGDYMGNHGFWWKGLPAYEDIHRVPFIVRHPGQASRGGRSRAFQSLVDLGHSFLKAAGVEPPPLIQGVDQNPSWSDAARAVRGWADLEWRPCDAPFMQKVFWHENWKIVFYSDPGMMGELYDLDADPGQSRNLWDDPSRQDLKKSLMLRFIAAEMEKDGVRRPRPAWA